MLVCLFRGICVWGGGFVWTSIGEDLLEEDLDYLVWVSEIVGSVGRSRDVADQPPVGCAFMEDDKDSAFGGLEGAEELAEVWELVCVVPIVEVFKVDVIW